MNNIFLLAWMDDWQMSARLAKLSSSYSYELVFCENGFLLPNSVDQSILIIDLDNVKEDEFHKVRHLKDDESVFIIGYALDMDGAQIKHYRELGYDMVLRRKKLLRNLGTILQKVLHVY